MDKYYYFASSLPLLSFEGKIPFSIEDFLNDCERLMGTADYQLMKHLLQDDSEAVDTQNVFLNEWVENVRKFRNEMVFYRSSKIHKDPNAYVRGTRYPAPYFMGVLESASKTGDPLAAEKMMDYVRWQFLDNMCANHYFDFEFIMCYGLKLKLLERYDAFNSPRGKEYFVQMKEEIAAKSQEKIEAVS